MGILVGRNKWNRKLLKAMKDPKWDMQVWNILTALRGPDCGSEELKRKYTYLIRAWATTDEHAVPLLYRGWQKEDLLASIRKRIEWLRTDTDALRSSHYGNHIRVAYNAILDIEKWIR
jgi:hypothetical protein